MAIDGKYGRVATEHGNIGEDEPVVVFRAQDALLPELLSVYRVMCSENGSPYHHLALIDETRDQVLDWQDENANRVRVPNSNSYMERTQADE